MNTYTAEALRDAAIPLPIEAGDLIDTLHDGRHILSRVERVEPVKPPLPTQPGLYRIGDGQGTRRLVRDIHGEWWWLDYTTQAHAEVAKTPTDAAPYASQLVLVDAYWMRA